jgi:hypothetical protein
LILTKPKIETRGIGPIDVVVAGKGYVYIGSN